ncbi:putative RDD family membrane protein YckC [Lewinella aquimaris]|uniref:Putative RDD family membrane protein YckC n=1 Tax=Neolewinella aquimaris TaxID=1835722 RepID=A0A840E3D0_9BACT|nr:RDD family protein [Neolewinella aquimaris]MBB4077557.1 putative RDD family membrane protein YckC [Neolewinella aquimaris]
MGVFGRYILYLLDCVVMLGILALVFLLFRGELPFGHDPERWLEVLLDGGSVYVTTLLGATLYWFIIDYHPTVAGYRRSRVAMLADGRRPDNGTRLLRSFIKAFTLFGGEVLLLFALFSDGHRFLHDYIAQTERIKLADSVD